TSTVLAFPYRDHHINLLDTPGHQDFSEDTYRTLTAVDSAVMVLDAARGIEPQTLKLFEVCKQRNTPIFTFVNKLDRPAQHPLEILDEIERTLGIRTIPLNWPIGDGPDFRGVYDIRSGSVHVFERTEHGSKRAPVRIGSLNDASLDALIGARMAASLREDVELIEAAGAELDLDAILRGELTPVSFGSAITNFGVELFLNTFVEMAPPPGPRETSTTILEPDTPAFSAFVFKIQANMDPRHRDRVAYMRICSGRYERDMEVWHARMKRTVRLAPPLRIFGQEREVIDEAYAGDVIGVINPGMFAIGDTVSGHDLGTFAALPRFQPEHFALLRAMRTDKYKQFLKGLTQIEEEGAIQLFYPVSSGRREPILAAVGALQFDVVRFRLESEYGVETILEPLNYSAVRWASGDTKEITELANSR
ncbi:MAG TPA: peptide chain release factor 3, partial [Thermomicrobiales bacterium]|nr:peptide chain release factor 3 [Thermomicrobiales bacterium]